MNKVGNTVKVKAEWHLDPNHVPSGRIVSIAVWGKDGAFYIEGDHRAWAAYLFDTVLPDQPEFEFGNSQGATQEPVMDIKIKPSVPAEVKDKDVVRTGGESPSFLGAVRSKPIK